MILASASVVNYDRQSDAPIWSITSSGVNYDRNKFIIQATGSVVTSSGQFIFTRVNRFIGLGTIKMGISAFNHKTIHFSRYSALGALTSEY